MDYSTTSQTPTFHDSKGLSESVCLSSPLMGQFDGSATEACDIPANQQKVYKYFFSLEY